MAGGSEDVEGKLEEKVSKFEIESEKFRRESFPRIRQSVKHKDPLHPILQLHTLGTLQLGNRQLGWTCSSLAAGNLAGVNHSGKGNSSFGKRWHLEVPDLALKALALGNRLMSNCALGKETGT